MYRLIDRGEETEYVLFKYNFSLLNASQYDYYVM